MSHYTNTTQIAAAFGTALDSTTFSRVTAQLLEDGTGLYHLYRLDPEFGEVFAFSVFQDDEVSRMLDDRNIEPHYPCPEKCFNTLLAREPEQPGTCLRFLRLVTRMVASQAGPKDIEAVGNLLASIERSENPVDSAASVVRIWQRWGPPVAL